MSTLASSSQRALMRFMTSDVAAKGVAMPMVVCGALALLDSMVASHDPSPAAEGV